MFLNIVFTKISLFLWSQLLYWTLVYFGNLIFAFHCSGLLYGQFYLFTIQIIFKIREHNTIKVLKDDIWLSPWTRMADNFTAEGKMREQNPDSVQNHFIQYSSSIQTYHRHGYYKPEITWLRGQQRTIFWKKTLNMLNFTTNLDNTWATPKSRYIMWDKLYCRGDFKRNLIYLETDFSQLGLWTNQPKSDVFIPVSFHICLLCINLYLSAGVYLLVYAPISNVPKNWWNRNSLIKQPSSHFPAIFSHNPSVWNTNRSSSSRVLTSLSVVSSLL